MIPELGHFALIMALGLAVIQGIVPLIGAQIGRGAWMAVARPAAAGQFGFLLLSFVCLGWSFVQSDFSVLYVASNSNSALPLGYRISAIWGAHEGSLLLWVLMLAGWGFAVALFSRTLPQSMVARILAVLGLVSVGFLLFTLLTSNPFLRLLPPAIEGRDLNPLLQDPGLIIHPPLLYMGYVGFSVAFAFAIAALISGQADSTWARWSRPWTTIAWLFLTLGIMLGSWWAYNELGWGGWWFWDPVENASFMPWLAGTALIHSLAVTEKRGAFKNWTLLLAIFAFSLSLLGTFLVRSGVLNSVHAFANDPERGVFILIFLGVVVGISLLLYAWRAPSLSSGGSFTLFSRETFLLFNNVLMAVAALAVLLGTLYPLAVEAAAELGWTNASVSVGAPYFDLVFPWLMIPALVLMGIGPMLKWKRSDPAPVIKQLRPLAILAALIGSAILVYFIFHGDAAPGPWLRASSSGDPKAFYDLVIMVIGPILGVWTILTALFAMLPYLKTRRGVVPLHVLGMVIAHVGIGVFTLGVTFTNSYDIERDIRVEPGSVVSLAGYQLRYNSTEAVAGPNFVALRGSVTVLDGERELALLHPEKRFYPPDPRHLPELLRLGEQAPRALFNPQLAQNMTEAAVHIDPFRDLYVSMGEPIGGGAWGVRVYYKPMIRWIWGGAILMALGAGIAVSDRRYRLRKRVAEARSAGVAVPT